MADTIKIRGGKKAGLPALSQRELGFTTDEEALYIGTNGQTKMLCKVGDPEKLAALSNTVTAQGTAIGELNTNKLTATKTAAQGTLSLDADLAAVITAYNNLIAALKQSGVMA